MKILLGGVPFGCDNIGDEAILNCVIKIFRSIDPKIDITVATKTQEETAKKHAIKTCPLFGFDPSASLNDFKKLIVYYDLFVWAGATGLSDYPQMACDLLNIVHEHGKRSIVWQVGMNTQLNPAFFQLRGRRKQLARFFGGGAFWENRRIKQAQKMIANTLKKSDLVIVRNASSLNELRKCAPFEDAIYGADSAIIQEESNLLLPPTTKKQTLALCLSAQSAITQLDCFATFLDTLSTQRSLRIAFISMNPITDRSLMEKIYERMKNKDACYFVEAIEPEDIQAIVGQCQLVISSRLHLIILGLNRAVPAIGITRGSKVPIYLEPFGLPVAGDTMLIDFEKLNKDACHLLDQEETFKKCWDIPYKKMQSDLDKSITLLRQKLNQISKSEPSPQ